MTENVARRVGDRPTNRQIEIYEWIYRRAREDGFQPSIRETADHFGIASPNGVYYTLRMLAFHGWIDFGDHHSRALVFLRRPDGREFDGFRDPPNKKE